ncbi:MAG: UDP-N-acetylglucosamine 2-epimerase (non-hydrolyzing) [Bacteroidetes bacterium]|nr:UDP-N-acetylglucosamine 2-epimerase (non-hydrolyzing) [Bacteroidota bacterium]
MKIVTVLGARPQFVKAAVVSREISRHSLLDEIIVHTGQHFDKNMSEIFFREMEIPEPAYHLNIHSLSQGAMTGQMLEKVEKVIADVKPGLVLVYGDTNSTLAGALAARKLNIPLAHVEAGLRSYNMRMPEEINRIVTDRISDHLFCPSETAVRNLEREAFHLFGCSILNTGDVMYDAVLFYQEKASLQSTIISKLNNSEFVLCTLHRAENTDDVSKLASIISALNTITETIPVVLPLHPRTRKIMDTNKIKLNFDVIEPVGYFDMLELLKHCKLVMTDSGGLQKEAYFFQKPCVTLRDETEWTELVECGYNKIAGSDAGSILRNFEAMRAKQFSFDVQLYGDGRAGKKIVDAILSLCNSDNS